jgi:hypothetical protein
MERATFNVKFQSFLQTMPAEIANSLSAAQMTALEAALERYAERKSHSVDMRMRFGIGQRGFYTVLLAGPESRPAQRRSYEMQLTSQLLALGVAFGLFVTQFVLLAKIF